MSRQSIPAEERAQIEEALRQGQESIGAIARRFGRGKASISRIAAKAGIDTALVASRSSTKSATEARMADVRKRYADMAGKLLDTADELHKRIGEPHLAFAFGGKDNDYNEHLLDRPDARTVQAYMTSIGIAMDKVKAILAGEDEQVSDAKGLLTEFMQSVREAAK